LSKVSPPIQSFSTVENPAHWESLRLDVACWASTPQLRHSLGRTFDKYIKVCRLLLCIRKHILKDDSGLIIEFVARDIAVGFVTPISKSQSSPVNAFDYISPNAERNSRATASAVSCVQEQIVTIFQHFWTFKISTSIIRLSSFSLKSIIHDSTRLRVPYITSLTLWTSSRTFTTTVWHIDPCERVRQTTFRPPYVVGQQR
jgi:hypothetical protein